MEWPSAVEGLPDPVHPVILDFPASDQKNFTPQAALSSLASPTPPAASRTAVVFISQPSPQWPPFKESPRFSMLRPGSLQRIAFLMLLVLLLICIWFALSGALGTAVTFCMEVVTLFPLIRARQ